MQNKWLLALILVVSLVLTGVFACLLWQNGADAPPSDIIPPYTGAPYTILNGNVPAFSEKEKAARPYEFYSELDAYNRCGYAMACIGLELMPTEERGGIGQIKPSGWQTVKYDFIDGKYLYNRCHLIGYQLTGENSNPLNLITGTRYLNTEGMLPFENLVADYVKETGNRVLYRVTPDFHENENLARGVKIEAWSIEDMGQGICFCVYAYNVQPGVVIDYSTGGSGISETETEIKPAIVVYVLNNASKRFHVETCGQGKNIKAGNREVFSGNRIWLLVLGYKPAGCCNP